MKPQIPIDDLKNDKPVVELYYFTGVDCSVCLVLKPKIESLLANQFPCVSLRSIDIKTEAVLASQFSVFTLPVLLILVDEREHARFVRSFSVIEVEGKLQRLLNLIGV